MDLRERRGGGHLFGLRHGRCRRSEGRGLLLMIILMIKRINRMNKHAIDLQLQWGNDEEPRRDGPSYNNTMHIYYVAIK